MHVLFKPAAFQSSGEFLLATVIQKLDCFVGGKFRTHTSKHITEVSGASMSRLLVGKGKICFVSVGLDNLNCTGDVVFDRQHQLPDVN